MKNRKQSDCEPLLVGSIPNMARSYTQGWQKNKEQLQVVLDRFRYIGVGMPDNDGLHRLINDTEAYIFDLHSGGTAEISGTQGRHLEVDKQAAAAIYKKPLGYDALLAAITACRKECMNAWDAALRYNPADVLQHFTMEEGVLQFSPAQQARMADAGNCYARTERGQAIYRFLEKLSAAFIDEGLDKLCLAPSDNLENRLPDLLMPILNDTFRGIDRKTKKPIVEMQGTPTNATFAGDRLYNY